MITKRLKAVILRELALDDFPLSEATAAYEVPGWDSLSHVRIVLAVEKEFGVRFRGHELIPVKNVGEMLFLIKKKCGVAIGDHA